MSAVTGDDARRPDGGGADVDIAAFAPTALTAGAILPQEARRTLQSADGLPGAVVDAERDGWATPEIPVLVRGRGRSRARIVPLAWLGDPAVYNPHADPGQIAVFASSLQSAGMYWSGPWRVLDELESEGLDSVGSYLAALQEAGVHRADIWRYSESEGLVLAWAGDELAGTMSLALHVVPVSWVTAMPRGASKRRARDWEPVYGIDLRWSWADVVALHAERVARAAAAPTPSSPGST
ncbi:hypothetical protein [Leucobacter ruminantium]|uniref:Uncharacterized protein n=1 Tax=Leucobacter ruminantium TaxID=1289170 RepID=A0A939RTV0_9MICO|nr:hypothetical protein [Leucobacter ruminantium]MBO1804875.1 hypothetical protein [Leucobacter ruminantium]